VLSSAGENNSSSSAINLEWTLGELVVQTASTNNMMFTQGFHQPSVINKSIRNLNSQLITWPNPSEDIVYVSMKNVEEKSYLTLADINGSRIYLQTFSKDETTATLDLNNIRPGIYLLSLRNASGEILDHAKICKIK
jgi:hypothetical protein